MALYKEYEGLLRADNIDPKTVEDDTDELDGNRLRMCRQFRNYFAHVQDPGFLEPTEKMMAFLQGEVNGCKMKKQPVKKYLKKPEACMLKPTQKVADALAMFAKLKCDMLLVDDGSGKYTVLSLFDILQCKPTAKIGICRTRKVKVSYCSPYDDVSWFSPEMSVLCTEDGTAGGKLLGQVWLR